jgi:hypothetical protein
MRNQGIMRFSSSGAGGFDGAARNAKMVAIASSTASFKSSFTRSLSAEHFENFRGNP